MKFAVIGCGYVADRYGTAFAHHPELTLAGAFDQNPEYLETFCRRWKTSPYANFQSVIEDPEVEMVFNLTNPRSHYEITRACLEAGKHVYSEKPLAMDCRAASELVELAEQKGLYLASAPCSVLSETAQTMWKAIKDGAVGKIRLVYANFDDGLIAPHGAPWNWRNDAGIPWPAKDEFEVGCTFEHAGYLLTWLAAFFGPARRVTAFASCQIPDKGISVELMAPDFTVGCIEYDNGVVARVTCGLVAPRDKSITLVGDDGVIFVPTVRNDTSAVYVRPIPQRGRAATLERRLQSLQRWIEKKFPFMTSEKEWTLQTRYPFARLPSRRPAHFREPVDFCRGPSEMAAAIREKRPCRLSARLGLHVTELVEVLQYPERFARPHQLTTAFDPIDPLPWDAKK